MAKQSLSLLPFLLIGLLLFFFFFIFFFPFQQMKTFTCKSAFRPLMHPQNTGMSVNYPQPIERICRTLCEWLFDRSRLVLRATSLCFELASSALTAPLLIRSSLLLYMLFVFVCLFVCLYSLSGWLNLILPFQHVQALPVAGMLGMNASRLENTYTNGRPLKFMFYTFM